MALVNTYIPDTQLFHDLQKMDRDNFSYEGAKALMEYLEELSEDIGENIEYDPIAFCCDYTEYTLPEEFQTLYDDYGHILDNDDKDAILEELSNHTTVIEFNGGIIIQSF